MLVNLGPSIQSIDLYPHHLPYDATVLPKVKQPSERSKGLHASTVYVNYCVDAGLQNVFDPDDLFDEDEVNFSGREVTNGNRNWALHAGLAWETYMAAGGRTNIFNDPNYEYDWQPGELTAPLSNGHLLYMTPDILSANVTWPWKIKPADKHYPVVPYVVDDLKFTKKSSASEFQEVWKQQAVCYLYGYQLQAQAEDSLDFTKFRFWVLYINGDYGKELKAKQNIGSKTKEYYQVPRAKVHFLDFGRTPGTVRKLWDVLDSYACRNYNRLIDLEHSKREHEQSLTAKRREVWPFSNVQRSNKTKK